MLPAAHRLRSSEQFRTVVRRGSRAGSRTLVVHMLRDCGADEGARAGFVVSRSVGNSVVRHRVQRKLRHLMAARLDGLPPGSAVVVRAHASSAVASSEELGRELDSALARVLQ